MTKWLITHSAKNGAKWRLVEFGGPTGAESGGIVDMIAIRKDHRRRLDRNAGDIFEIVLIQVKGGSAKMPSAADIIRLAAVKEYHRANEVVLSEWRKKEKLQLRRLVGTEWQLVEDPAEILGKVRLKQ
jgi:hypothetical protein